MVLPFEQPYVERLALLLPGKVAIERKSHSRTLTVTDANGVIVAEATIKRGKAATFEQGTDYPQIAPGAIGEAAVVAVITWLEIHDDQRERGIGTLFANWMLAYAAAWQVPAVYLHAAYYAETPAEFWARFGFVDVEEDKSGNPYMRLGLEPKIMESPAPTPSPATPDMRNLKVRSVSIECIEHPEWGTWGVMEDHGHWYDIHGKGGSRVLHKSEAAQFWRVVPSTGFGSKPAKLQNP